MLCLPQSSGPVGVGPFLEGLAETFRTDHWRCRFRPTTGEATLSGILALLAALHAAGYDIIKTEHLYRFDGERAYSLGQGE